MSELGQKRHHDFCFTSESGHRVEQGACPLSANSCHSRHLFDHLVGACEHGRRYRQAKCLRGFEVDGEFVLGRRLHREIGCLFALEDAIDVTGSEQRRVDPVTTVSIGSCAEAGPDHRAVNGYVDLPILPKDEKPLVEV